MDPKIILKAVSRGEEISPIEAIILMQNYDSYRHEIHAAADSLNKKLNKNVVTYSHCVHVAYTNVCRYSCRVCSFFRKKKKPGAFTLSINDVTKKITKTPSLTQVNLYGGLNSELPFSYYTGILKAIRKEFSNITIQAFSPMEIFFIAKRSKQNTREVLKKLKEAGLNALGGSGSEILNDKIRKKVCPDKIRTSEWRDIVRTAHRLGINSVASILFGHLEDEIHICEHLEIVRNIQRETGGFTQFVPIPFSLSNVDFSELTKLTSKWYREQRLPEEDAIARLVSVSRIFFGRTMNNIQANWFTLGMENALSSLKAGANDLGETIFDDTAIKNLRKKNGSVISQPRIRRVIMKAGKTPRPRSVHKKASRKTVRKTPALVGAAR